jgi:hypothetical protein
MSHVTFPTRIQQLLGGAELVVGEKKQKLLLSPGIGLQDVEGKGCALTLHFLLLLLLLLPPLLLLLPPLLFLPPSPRCGRREAIGLRRNGGEEMMTWEQKCAAPRQLLRLHKSRVSRKGQEGGEGAQNPPRSTAAAAAAAAAALAKKLECLISLGLLCQKLLLLAFVSDFL